MTYNLLGVLNMAVKLVYHEQDNERSVNLCSYTCSGEHFVASFHVASFPGSTAWAEKKEPGTHCLRIHVTDTMSSFEVHR